MTIYSHSSDWLDHTAHPQKKRKEKRFYQFEVSVTENAAWTL